MIVLVGAGGHCESIVDVIETETDLKIAGIVANPDEIRDSLKRFTILESDSRALGEANERYLYHVAVGKIGASDVRRQLFLKYESAGKVMASIIAQSAVVSPRARIGDGTCIMHGALIGPQATVGNNCIINSGAIVEHGAKIGDHTHIATRAVVNGGCQIGENCFIGSGAVIREGISVGNDSVIGAGTLLGFDTAAGTVMPAKWTPLS